MVGIQLVPEMSGFGISRKPLLTPQIVWCSLKNNLHLGLSSLLGKVLRSYGTHNLLSGEITSLAFYYVWSISSFMNIILSLYKEDGLIKGTQNTPSRRWMPVWATCIMYMCWWLHWSIDLGIHHPDGAIVCDKRKTTSSRMCMPRQWKTYPYDMVMCSCQNICILLEAESMISQMENTHLSNGARIYINKGMPELEPSFSTWEVYIFTFLLIFKWKGTDTETR